MKKRKIGIMGGTFNPIHLGHVALAQTAYDYCELDEVWFMPNGISYLKKDDNVVSGVHRLEMTRLAIQGMPNFRCSDLELLREGNTYTVDTLQELHEKHPGFEFYFIMGADSLFGLPKWKCPDEICKLAVLAAAVRDDVDIAQLNEQKLLLEHQYNAKIILVPFSKIDISSSSIRQRITGKKPVENMIPNNVLEYISQNKLYMED